MKYRRSRPGLIICDDLENDTLVETQEQRAKLKRWFFGALIPALKRRGKLIVIGTILHEDALLMELLSAKSWVSLRYAAIENGEPLWPENYSLADLDQIKEEYTAQNQLSLYYREYHNKIIDEETALFKREYFKYVTMTELHNRAEKEFFRTFLTLDPAYSTHKANDYSAFALVHTDRDKNSPAGS